MRVSREISLPSLLGALKVPERPGEMDMSMGGQRGPLR